MDIGDVACRGMARIDGNDFRAALLARGDKPLIKHRVAPGRVAADQNDEIGGLDIVVATRNDIFAERPDVPRHRRGHTESGIGVDITAADKTLHQLVGDVIILGQELSGDVERGRVRTVLGDSPAETGGNAVERFVPARIAADDLRIEQASVAGERVGERGALGAEPAEISRMVRISGQYAVGGDAYAAADAAIRTRGADHAACHCSPAPSSAAIGAACASRAFIACST